MAHDYYQRLGVARTANADEIKKAFRRQAKQYHPDVNPGNKAAEERFKQLNEAFEVLGDEKKRRLYDEFGDDAAKMGWDEKKAATYRSYRAQGPGRSGSPADFNFDFTNTQGGPDFETIFESMFGQQQRRGRRGPRPGADLSAAVEVTLREAVLGAERVLHVNGKRLAVKIPAGVETGSRVRLSGQGAPGEAGGPHGDLYVEVTVHEHPLVRRDGQDLELELPVTLREAMLGGEVRVPTFGGGGTVTLKPGTQSGTKLRLRGQGVPDLRGGSAGDLYLVVQVKVPPHGDEAVKKAVKVIEAAYVGDVREALVL